MIQLMNNQKPFTFSVSSQMTIFFILFLYAVNIVSAQTPNSVSAVSEEKIKEALKFVEENMDSLNAHRKYIYAMGLNTAAVEKQYEIWFKKYPDNANIPFAIGAVYFGRTLYSAKEYLLKTVQMNPKNAKAWMMLSSIASIEGEYDLGREYVKRATIIDASHAGYAYSYLRTFREGDPEAYKKMVFEYIDRFPKSDEGSYALYSLAANAVTVSDQVRYYELLYEKYAPENYSWTQSGMGKLCDIYLQTTPAKALEITRRMEKTGGDNWKNIREQVELYIAAQKLERENKYREALEKLTRIHRSKENPLHEYIALKKADLQDKLNGPSVAYDSLTTLYAQRPTDTLMKGLERYGRKLGKDQKQIDKDIETIRYSTAVPASPFELGLYTSDQKLGLNDLKGKVTLLTFWFPACGPCKEEFPHFQNVIDSYKGDKLEYVGINVLPSQDDYVLPFIDNNKFSFIPLRGTTKFALEKYNVTGQPENFIIDKDGKIVFRDFRIGPDNRRTLQLMISSLLDKESAQK